MTSAAIAALFSDCVRKAYRDAMRHTKSIPQKPTKEKRDLTEVRELLGPLAERYTDAQLDQLSRELTVGASLLLELYFQQKLGRAKPPTPL